MSDDFDFRFDPAQLRRLIMSPDGELAKKLEKMGQTVERGAKERCPVHFGRLRSSIGHEVGADAEGLYVVVGSDVEYAVYVELGTTRMAAQPYLVPAVADVQGGVP